MRWCGRLRDRPHHLFYDQGFDLLYDQGEALSSKVTHAALTVDVERSPSHSVSCDNMERMRGSGSRPMHLPREDNAAQGASRALGARSVVRSSMAAGCCMAPACCMARGCCLAAGCRLAAGCCLAAGCPLAAEAADRSLPVIALIVSPTATCNCCRSLRRMISFCR